MKRVIFRKFEFNQLTFPLLLNIWEKAKIDKKFEIKIISSLSQLKKINKEDLFIYSFMTPHIPLIFEEIKIIKKHGAKVAGGGPHITGEIELSKKIGIDYLLPGEGEESFLELGYDILNGKPKSFYPPQKADNFSNFIPVSKYIKNIPPIEIMRGCFWKCRYCQTGIYPVRFRDVESIKEYFYNVKKRGFKRVGFISPSSSEYMAKKGRSINIETIEQILKTAKSFGFKFIEYGIFPSEVRPDSLNEELLRVLKKYVTNRKLTVGAQSGTNERLKILRRGHTIEDVEKAVELANSYGFLVNLDFIFAYPDETDDEREETLKFIRKMNSNYRIKVHLHHFFPLSGSDYQWRKPSFLNEKFREKLISMRKFGFSTDWWIDGEKRTKNYFKFLMKNFPDYYEKYS